MKGTLTVVSRYGLDHLFYNFDVVSSLPKKRCHHFLTIPLVFYRSLEHYFCNYNNINQSRLWCAGW